MGEEVYQEDDFIEVCFWTLSEDSKWIHALGSNLYRERQLAEDWKFRDSNIKFKYNPTNYKTIGVDFEIRKIEDYSNKRVSF